MKFMWWMRCDQLLAPNPRTLLRAWLAVCALICIMPATVNAQIPPAPPPPPSELVDELRLPLEKITPDLLPDRIPVPLANYQALKKLAETTHAAPSPTRLLKAQYSAVYKDHRLADGQLTWSFENTSGSARTCVVEPLGIAVRELKWGERPAVWGTSPAGRFEVLLDRATGDLQGRWELGGKTVGQHDEFLLNLPRATVSQVILKVPSGAIVTAPGHSVLAGTAQEGIVPWTIVTTANQECRIVIHQPAATGAATPLILVQHDALYKLRQDGLRFLTSLRLEVTQAPVREIPIWVDPELEIYSITYGNEIPLPWKTTSVDGRQRLLVQLPDELLGTGRVLKLSGVSPIKTDVEWKLPNVVIAGSALVDGQAVLQLTPPLQLQDLSNTGYRQIGVDTGPTRDDLLTFKQFRSDGVLTVKLGKPRPRILARVLSDLQTQSSDWTCFTQLQLTGAEGAAFSVECRIPAGWDVIDVRDPNAPKLEWNVTTTPEGQRLLTLQFLEALTPDKPRTIEIDARRAAATGDQTFVVPAFEPLNIDDLGMLVVVNSAADVRPVLESGTSFEPCESTDLDPEWLNSKFWKTPLTERTPAPLLLRLNGNTAEGHFSLQSLQTPVEVSAEMQIEVSTEKILKTVKLKVIPRHGKTERVLVYQSEPGPQLAWTLAGTPPKPIEARKLPPFRHAAWDLPTSGELWELRLPQPQSTPFELEGTRTRGLTPTGRLGLVFVPQAQAFHGRVTVHAPVDLGVELTAWHTEADGIANAAATSSERVWTWHLPAAVLQFQTRDATALAPAPVIRRVTLQARWTLEPNSYDYYVAQLELGSGFNGRKFQCTLPDAAELTDVQVDGQSLQFPPPAPGLPIVLTNVTDEQIVAITYRAPSQGLLRPRWRSLVLPTLDIPVLRCDLELLTPAGFRLGSESRGMVLKSNATPISTLQRVFGPLGRSGHELLFNPFDANTWSQLWDNDPDVDPDFIGTVDNPPVRDVDSHDVPGVANLKSTTSTPVKAASHTGWQVWRGSAAMLPQRVELWLWSNRQAGSTAWLGFWTCVLLGTMLRLGRVPHRGTLGILAMAAEILLIFILPPLPAQLVGGCLAGTLLAFLWPRKLICRSTPSPEENPPIPQGSTHSYRPLATKSSAVMKLLTLMILCGGLASAQTTSPTNGNGSGAGLPRVIIPVDARNQPLGQEPLAYVPDRLLKDWTALQTSQARAPWLLRSGEYVLRRDAAQQVALTARYEVTVLSDAAEVEVLIPLTGVNFGGDQACLVDGQPHPVLARPDANALAVRLPGVVSQPMPENADSAEAAAMSLATRSFRIEFQGYPVIQQLGDRQWMDFALPRLHSALWTLQNDHPDSPWTLKTGETVYTVAPKQTWPRELGPLTKLRIEPTAPTTPAAAKPSLEARLVLLADVQPAVSQLHYQVSYRVLQGQVSSVSCQLPAGIAVREVSGPEVFDWHLIPAAGGASRLQVDLRSPVSEGFRVKVEALLPNEGPPSQLIIPPVLLLNPALDPLRPAAALVAIRTPSEFITESTPEAGEKIASATVDTFLKEWGMTGVEQKPQMAFSLLEPTPLKLGLRPLLAQRVVRMTAVGVLGSRRLQWSVNATIEVQTAAAYTHRIEIDPRLTVTSVSIQEDAANRLLRWTRTGNILHVFLRDKTTGTQTLALQGTMPTQVPQEMALPAIRFLDATLMDSKLQLYQEPDLEVEVADPDKWERLEVPSELRLGAARNLLVGRFKWNPESGPFLVRAAQNEPVLNYSAVTSLQPRDGRWKLTTNLLFEVLQGHGSQFSIRIPPELPLVRVDAADVRQLLERETDGSQRIVLVPQAPVRGPFVVQVSGDVSLPAGGPVVIPEILGLNATRKDHFLVLPADGQLTVDPRSSGLMAESLPDPLGKLLPADLQGTPRSEYRGSPGIWTVTIPRRQEDQPQTGVLWTETQIWCGPGGQVSGRTSVLLGPQEIEHIELDIPTGIELQGVLLDGEFIPHTSREQHLRIPLTFPQAGHAITLYWTQATGSFSGFYNRATFQWPRVAGKSVGEEYVTVTPPAGFRLHARQGKSVERIQVQLSELQRMLELMQQRAAGGPAPQDPQWVYLQRQVGSLIKRLQAEPQLRNPTGELSQQYSQLKTRFAAWEQTTVPVEPSTIPGGLSPAVLRSFSSLEGNLAGPHSLLLQLDGDNSAAGPLRVSVIHESLSNVAGGVGLAVVVLALIWPLLRWKFPEWLAEQPAVAWLLLGLIWWPCLTPSWLGLVWLALAAFYAIRHILRATIPPTDPAADRDFSQPALT